jgi:hypothetical protein
MGRLSWKPVTGCLHGCPYCYARNIARDIYPPDVGFAPTLWLDRLTAPANQRVPDRGNGAARSLGSRPTVEACWLDKNDFLARLINRRVRQRPSSAT